MGTLTCRNLDIGRAGFDLFACGCSSNRCGTTLIGFSVRKYAQGVSRSGARGYGACKSIFSRFNIARCRVFPAQCSEELLNGTGFFANNSCAGCNDFTLIGCLFCPNHYLHYHLC